MTLLPLDEMKVKAYVCDLVASNIVIKLSVSPAAGIMQAAWLEMTDEGFKPLKDSQMLVLDSALEAMEEA